MSELALHTHESEGCLVVALAGEIDTTNSAGLVAELIAVIETATGPVVLEWSDVTFCDSSGINTVVVVTRHARTHAVPLALAGVRGRVANVFTLTALDRVVPLYPDVEAALRAFSAGQQSSG
ncbi:MAG: STAS domain-containing protein [Streptosporangiaceae bacterium]